VTGYAPICLPCNAGAPASIVISAHATALNDNTAHPQPATCSASITGYAPSVDLSHPQPAAASITLTGYTVNVDLIPNDVVINQTLDPITQDMSLGSIVFTHTGQLFEPYIEVDTGATVLWTFADSTTSNSTEPSKDFGSAATRQTSLVVQPFSALRVINIGYAQEDGATVDIPLRDQQNVTNISGLRFASGIWAFTADYTPNLQHLDFSGFDSLRHIEIRSSGLITCRLDGCSSVERLSIENSSSFRGTNSSTYTLDLSSCVALGDIRMSMTAVRAIEWGSTGSALWHLCSRRYDLVMANTDPSNARFTGLREFWSLYAPYGGHLSFASTQMVSIAGGYNKYVTVDLRGAGFTAALRTQYGGAVCYLPNSQLRDVYLSGCSGFSTLDLSYNCLDETAVDRVLTDLDADWVFAAGASVDLRGNAIPSATGLAAVSSLQGKGFTVNYQSSLTEANTGSSEVTIANVTGSGTGCGPTDEGVCTVTLDDITGTASDATAPVLEYCASYVQSSATHTETGVSIGTAHDDRVIVLLMGGRADGIHHVNPTVTIGGNAATIAVSSLMESYHSASIAYLAVPSGTTADIYIDYPLSVAQIQIDVYAISNLDAQTPTGSAARGQPDAGWNGNPEVLTLATSNGGVVICHANDEGGTAPTITSATIDYTNTPGRSWRCGHLSDVSASESYSVTFGGMSYGACCAIAFK
jgi:hypothetical protein